VRYGKTIILTVMVAGLTACSWIPPTNEQPPGLPAPDLQTLHSNAPDAKDIGDAETQVWPDDAAPAVVPPGLQK
jgi:hypothetical protein